MCFVDYAFCWGISRHDEFSPSLLPILFISFLPTYLSAFPSVPQHPVVLQHQPCLPPDYSRFRAPIGAITTGSVNATMCVCVPVNRAGRGGVGRGWGWGVRNGGWNRTCAYVFSVRIRRIAISLIFFLLRPFPPIPL